MNDCQSRGVLAADPAGILRERARRLAAWSDTLVGDRRTASVLVFGLGSEDFALPVETISEVVPFAGCTPVPRAPAEVLGVINLRGVIHPVIDLRCLLGLDAGPEEHRPAHILFLRRGRGLGLLVGQAKRIERVDIEQLLRPATDATADHHFVRGILPGSFALLDLDAALSALHGSKATTS